MVTANGAEPLLARPAVADARRSFDELYAASFQGLTLQLYA